MTPLFNLLVFAFPGLDNFFFIRSPHELYFPATLHKAHWCRDIKSLIDTGLEATEENLLLGISLRPLQFLNPQVGVTGHLKLDGHGGIGWHGLGALLTIAGPGIAFHNVTSKNLSVDLLGLHAQAKSGLVRNTGNHGDAVISHLIEIGVIRAGDRAGKDDLSLSRTTPGETA